MTPQRPRLCAVYLSKAIRLGDGGRLSWWPCELRNTSFSNSPKQATAYFNQPRCLKYHMGSKALATIKPMAHR